MMNVDAQSTAELPRLVVNILVDQLRADYLETFSPLYGEKGFKRLMAEARFYADSQQPFVDADRASAAATLVTGAVPRDHGIPSMTWLSRQTLQPLYCVDDTRYKGIETFDQSSPNYLLTSALSDELKQATARKSLVYSIAPERDMAVLMAAHVADGAYWIDDQTGSWCSSSFYGKQTPDGKTIGNSTDLAMYLLEKGHVATVGGDAFGDPACFRMSYATSDENIVEAMRRIKDVLGQLK